jgi:hypothetical protein
MHIVNRNSITSTFLFVWSLDESCDHAVWYYSIETTTTIQYNVNLWNNNFKYCFNKLYYDCKHLKLLFQKSWSHDSSKDQTNRNVLVIEFLLTQVFMSTLY